MLSRSGLLLTVLLACLTAGCAHFAEPRDKTSAKAPKLSKERQMMMELVVISTVLLLWAIFALYFAVASLF